MRSIIYVCVAALAFAAGCQKKDDYSGSEESTAPSAAPTEPAPTTPAPTEPPPTDQPPASETTPPPPQP
jgi:hypothetical protein